MNSSIGKRLKSAREAAGLNQVECAKAAGISQPYLAQIEAGSKQPKTEVLQRLAATVQVSVAWLLDHVSEQNEAYADGRLATLNDELAAPGLRHLAEDEPMCHVLEISDEEWAALRSLVLSNPPDKNGYLLILYAVRASSQRNARA
jgi:transcriptional regulator with XRE-family HTH domain